MGKIIYIDLASKTSYEEKYELENAMHYGRGLAAYLVLKNTEYNTDRYDEKNCIVMVPGLLSGTLVPSTGRLIVASKKSSENGIQYVNIAGPFSQKMASINIDAIVIKGCCNESVAYIHIDDKSIVIHEDSSLYNKKVSETISYIRNKYSQKSSVIGIGPIGERVQPLASIFSTYMEGIPSYYCSRGGMGDILGSKGIKAIAISSDFHFNSKTHDEEALKNLGKELTKLIIEHPVCGDALPAYGSITLMKMMKDGKQWNKAESKEDKIKNESTDKQNSVCKINKTCAPLCVVGCLNRHSKSDDSVFLAPAESEVYAAIKKEFGIDDKSFSSNVNREAFELGIDSVEFVFTCSLMSRVLNKTYSKEDILNALKEIDEDTLQGRTLCSTTRGIYSLYNDKKNLKYMVSKPSITEENMFNISLPYKVKEYEDLNDLEYLYASMITLENLGFCLFTSFAFFDKQEGIGMLSDLFYYKTGIKIKEKDLIEYSLKCLSDELEAERQSKTSSIQKRIPEFVKVLYRYFDMK